jgi:hypothetical protein
MTGLSIPNNVTTARDVDRAAGIGPPRFTEGDEC